MDKIMEGSCHCGKVNFETKNNPRITVNCHCDDCKKRNGSAFSTYLGISENDFLITNGESYLKRYDVDNSGEKYFCSECGSPIYNKNYQIPGMYMVLYGAFLQPDKFTPSFNVYCSTKLEWIDDIKTITSFQESIKK